MKFTLIACFFFASFSAFGAPIDCSRSTTTTAIASSAGNDEPITEVVTVTITMTPTTSHSLPTSTSPPGSTSTTLTSPTSSEVPQEPAPSQALLNAQEAQKLNSSFRDIKLTDACTTGTTACVEGGAMTCNGERWVGVVCPGSEQCFAVPVDSLTDVGTRLGCMTEQAAESLIANAGATGGILGGQ